MPATPSGAGTPARQPASGRASGATTPGGRGPGGAGTPAEALTRASRRAARAARAARCARAACVHAGAARSAHAVAVAPCIRGRAALRCSMACCDGALIACLKALSRCCFLVYKCCQDVTPKGKKSRNE